jgi:type I restriction enzyme S subunit
MNNLPDKWDVKPLGEACKTIKGKKPKNSGPATTERTVPYINIKAFESGQPVEFAAPGNYPTCERDDVLIVWDGARAGLSGRAVPGYIGSTLAKVYSDVADNRYLFYFLQSQYGRINSRTKGVGIPHVDPTIFNNIPFPIAPPEQQKHIVAEIEKQFSRLNEAVANLKRVKANLKRYKAAVLKAAVEGRLVETEAEVARREGRNYETGTQLLQRILETRRSQWKGKGKYKEPAAPDTTDLPELPEGWMWANWEQVGFSQNGRPFPSSDYCDKGVRLLRPGNLHESGALVWTAENTRHMPPQYAGKNPDLIVKGRELVMNLTAQSLKDEFLGRVCFTADGEHCLLNQRLARLIPIEVVPEFVLVVFKSKWFRRFIDGLNTGSLIQHMFTSQLATFAFPIPPIAEQHRIVAEVDRRLSLVRGVETQVDANFQRVERLRQSILLAAFSGTLTSELRTHDNRTALGAA